LASNADEASVEDPASVETALLDLLQPLPANTESPARRAKDQSTLWDFIVQSVAKRPLLGKIYRAQSAQACDRARIGRAWED